jgi:CubicO group peptidase (beta-lactamase class C family)
MGVVVAAVRDDAVEIRAAGHVAEGGHRPQADTLFEIGSVTKVFTALTLARTVLAGTVSLDEPVRDLLPSGTAVPGRGGREITVRNLAMHTSGLPRLPAGLLRRALLNPGHPDPYADCTAESVLAGLARTRLRRDPGDRFRYSNLGAGLLGLALATRTGLSYESLVAREVCAPLGLVDTVVIPDAARADRLATGHTRRRRATPPWDLAALAGAGGLRSTAADLVTFLRAHLDPAGELAEAIRLCLEQTHPSGRLKVHLGWIELPLPARMGGATQIWHDGGTGGFRSFVGFVPQHRTAVAVLGNTARPVDPRAFDLLRVLSFGGELRP